MQFLMSLMFLWDVASLCFWECMFHAVYRIFKVYLRTLDIEHRIYRRKQNLLNLPYSHMITICSFSTVMICVKRIQMWSNGYCPCYMLHDFYRFFFLFVSSFQLYFNFFQLPALATDIVSYHVLCCHDIRIFLVLSYWMKCWLFFVCICRIFFVCVCIFLTNVNIATLDLMIWYDYM